MARWLTVRLFACSLTNFESVLLSVLKKYNVEQLFLQSKESNQWSELTMLTKLDIIYTLCEFRLQLNDVELKITVSGVAL